MASIIYRNTLHILYDKIDYTKELYRVNDMKLFPDFHTFKNFIQSKINQKDFKIVKEESHIFFKTNYELDKQIFIINIKLKESEFIKKIREIERIVSEK